MGTGGLSNPTPEATATAACALPCTQAARSLVVGGGAGRRVPAGTRRLELLPSRQDKSGTPPWRASPCRRLDRLDVDPAARDQPRDHRVRVPHVTGLELIATPDGRRNARRQLQHAPRTISIVGKSPRAFDSLGGVRDSAVAPSTDLVAEDPNPTCPATADRTFSNDATPIAALVTDRCLFDHEPAVRDADFERGVVEVAGRPVRKPRGHSLEDTTVKPNEVPAGAEGQPVQVDGGDHPTRREAVGLPVMTCMPVDVAHSVILSMHVDKPSGSGRRDGAGIYGAVGAALRTPAERDQGGQRKTRAETRQRELLP